MREVAKSMVGFSWAVSLFGLQQLSKILTPGASAPEATTAEFEEVSRAVQSHLSEPLVQQFRAGDEWQRRLVDALFDAAAMRSLDPRKMAASLDPRPLMDSVDPRALVQTGFDVIQKSVDTLRGVATKATPGSSPTSGGAAPAA